MRLRGERGRGRGDGGGAERREETQLDCDAVHRSSSFYPGDRKTRASCAGEGNALSSNGLQTGGGGESLSFREYNCPGPSVAEADPQVARGNDGVGIERHALRSGERLFDRHGHDGGRLQGHHVPEALFGDQAHGGGAEAQSQQAVERGRAAAALQVSQYERAGLLPGQLLDGVGHAIGDPPEAAPLAVEIDFAAPLRQRPFGHDDDAEVASLGFSAGDLVTHLLEVEGDFGDEDDVGRAGEARVEGDEPAVPSHYLDDHHPLVALRGRVELVGRFGGGSDGRVEPEGGHGAADVVVDGLGDADDGDALRHQPPGEAERPVAADGDEHVEPVGAERRDELVGTVSLSPGAVGGLFPPAEGVAAVGGAEDSAAEMGDAADFAGAEGDDFVAAEQAVEAAPDAGHLPSPVHGGEDGPADDGVEARRIPAAGGDGDLHRRSSPTISPGSAWRFSDFLENTRRPSASTSKKPPEDSMSFTSASGNALRISAARPVARGS